MIETKHETEYVDPYAAAVIGATLAELDALPRHQLGQPYDHNGDRPLVYATIDTGTEHKWRTARPYGPTLILERHV